MRIAYFSPLSPQHSGITDHSEEVLPYLAEHGEIDLVVSGAYQPSNADISARFRIVHYEEYLRDPSVYDAAVYQLGNNLRYHAYMVPCMRAAPGIIVLQDYSLQYLVLGLTLRRGERQALLETLKPVYGARSPALVRRLMLGLEDPAEMTFAHPFLEAARGIIVNSQHAFDLVHKQVPDKPVKNIPMGIVMPSFDESVEQLRARYGYGKDDFIVASVSTRAPKKRLDVALEAIREARKEIPGLRFLIVGGGSPGDRIHRMIRDYGLSDIVEQTGWVDAQRYQDLVHLSNVGIDLRDMTAAETAHSALRLITSGVPVVVSACGTFLDLPDSCCPKLAPDETQAARLAGLFSELARDPERLQTMKSAALDYAQQHLSLEVQARDMMAYIGELAETTPGSGRVELLEPGTDFARPLFGLLYSASRAGFLLRRYGISDSLRRLKVNLASRLRPNKPETM